MQEGFVLEGMQRSKKHSGEIEDKSIRLKMETAPLLVLLLPPEEWAVSPHPGWKSRTNLKCRCEHNCTKVKHHSE